MRNRVANYVASVRTLQGTLFLQQTRLDEWLQTYRLGGIPRDRLAAVMPQAAGGMDRMETLWRQMIPPPNLVTVHNYAVAAVSETHAGVQITADNFLAGGGSIPPAASAHFQQSDQLMSAALAAIDTAAGP